MTAIALRDRTEAVAPVPTLATAGSGLQLLPACSIYELPGNPEKDCYAIPVSGGGDSSFLAILMVMLFPHIPFQFVFTDTKADPAEIYECLDRLELYIGRKIERITPEKGLYELIESYGGFIPSASARYCTRELKLVGFEKWMTRFAGRKLHMFVGIRADEDRVAFTLDNCETHFPFVALNIQREQIFLGLSKTIGIPKFYRTRTRSGCGPCFFQRRSELVGLLQYQPIEFKRGKAAEKVAQSDLDRHKIAPSLPKECGFMPPLPMPGDNAITGRVKRNASLDLFANAGLFVAVEYFFDSFCGVGEFCWAQRVVSYSPTLTGIARQVNDRYAHLLSTAEIHDMTPDDVRRDVRFGVFYIEAPAEVFDPKGPKDKGYTWQQGSSYAQLEHVIGWAERILRGHALAQTAEDLDEHSLLSWSYEQAQIAVEGMRHVIQPLGRVVNSTWLKPDEPKNDGVVDERFISCPACSI